LAATSSGALKATIEGLGFGISAYRDQPPPGQALPYVVIQERVAMTPDPLEDGALSTGTESVQVDLYETLGAETYAILPGILAGLHGSRLTASAKIGTKLVYVCLVRNVNRVVDLQMTQVRHIIDVDLEREL
jgi:hypothetical protein